MFHCASIINCNSYEEHTIHRFGAKLKNLTEFQEKASAFEGEACAVVFFY